MDFINYRLKKKLLFDDILSYRACINNSTTLVTAVTIYPNSCNRNLRAVTVISYHNTKFTAVIFEKSFNYYRVILYLYRFVNYIVNTFSIVLLLSSSLLNYFQL
ncbi:uncharacterized protein LOC142334005 [Lycorma delicatula]|uniref:uncharacterized protein LOC142334005 n=1 Tax=Lycorma delicatula TaxID=130591 RepID=UPI003F51076A